MDSDQDEPYENVIFRNSQIVYPPDLVMDADVTADQCVWDQETSEDTPTRPRTSLLEAFDPVLQRKSISPVGPQSYSDILSGLDLCPPVTPPPLPQRNPKAQVHYQELPKDIIVHGSPPPIPKRGASKMHAYDPVTIDKELGACVTQVVANQNDEESKTLNNQLVRNRLTKDNLRGLVNRVTNGDWLPAFKRATQPLEDSSFVNYTASPDVGHAGSLAWCFTSALRKEPQLMWTELKNGSLSCYSGSNAEVAVHVIKLASLVSIGASTVDDSHSFEILTSKDKSKVVLTATCQEEKTKWMEWILEAADPKAFNNALRQCYSRCAKVFIKEGVTGEWQRGWILAQAYSKQLWIEKRPGTAFSEDLRKVRSITQPKSGDIADCPLANQAAAPIIFHWSDHTLYVQSDSKADTEAWLQLTRIVALQSGENIEENQLTTDDVPVLVECCIKFIEAYGMLTEGIYRRSGVQSRVVKLLSLLRNDAWNVHISNEEYTEHDVANVLKRFLRTLPEPLLSNELYSHWIDGLSLEHDHQLKLYKHLIECLPKVHRQTLRKVLGHLHAVQNKCEKNLMSISNLAALWGPTLMTVESDRDHTSNFSHTNAETDVVLQLIQYYPWLFDVDREKLAVNDQISEVQERLEQGVLMCKKVARDIRTWIYSEVAAKEVALEIGPKVAVSDALKTLGGGRKKNAILMESICNGELRRPLSCKELLLPTILKWAEWPEEDRRNNQLVYGTHDVIDRLLAEEKKDLSPKTAFEVHYVDPKGKTFRSYAFDFSRARFNLLKDNKSRSLHGSWELEKIIWYFGCDPRRNPPANWCITFIEKDSPIVKKGRQFFGHCLSFTSELDLVKFAKIIIMTDHEGGSASFFM